MKRIDYKNVRWWEWLIVAFVAGMVLFPKKIFALISEVSINEGTVLEGKTGGKWWKKAIKIGLSFFGPIGDGVGELLNTLWPGSGWD